MIGYDADQWLSDPGLWQKLIHPDDRTRVLEEYNRHIADGTDHLSLITVY